MKPYIYGGTDPFIFFWVFIGLTVLMMLLFFYEETFSKNYWGKAGTWRLVVVAVLWFVALGLLIVTDGDKKGGLEANNAKVVAELEKTGLNVVTGEVDSSPNTRSTLQVKLPLKKGAKATDDPTTTNCVVFSPEDATQDIRTICGKSDNGMSPENLMKWNAAGEPEDTKKFDFSAEESKKIFDSVKVADTASSLQSQ